MLFEAQLGALRDIDYGIYPVHLLLFDRSRPTRPSARASRSHRLDTIVGIMKAYSTCVGEGPFTGELFGDEAD